VKALLMFPDRDFESRQPSPPPWKQRDRAAELLKLLRHQRDLIQDLELTTLLRAMAGEDTFAFDVAQQALLDGFQNRIETVLYRQEIVQDCLNNASVARDLYRLATETIDASRRHSIGGYWATPQSILYAAVEALLVFVGALRKLKSIAVEHDGTFRSRGFSTMLAMMRQEFNDDYFRLLELRLDELKFPQGVWESAGLGHGNEGRDYVLRQPPKPRPWIERILKTGPPAYTFHIPERDDAGFKALGELRDRGINLVANAVAQSAEHILSFFEMLRTELAFYIGCVNLHEKLMSLGVPLCFPEPRLPGGRRHHFRGLSDVSLALTMGRSVVENDLEADGRDLVIITGANQGDDAKRDVRRC
jgi:DNA mismatch repair ATPase MutS